MSVLARQRVIVSAGPTYEDLDPVRFLGNRSSGRMGFALAAAAAERGAEVWLVAGPVRLPTPAAVRRVDVRSAREMHAAVLQALPAALYLGAAAVADWRPVDYAPQKLKKQAGASPPVLSLVPNPDILADVARHAQRPRCVVGFAAETEADPTRLQALAAGKRKAKGTDVIIANRVGVPDGGFDSEDNAVCAVWAQGARSYGSQPKRVLAARLLDLIEEWLHDHGP
jgi:phosphopantothenoylcysteine decarboxylase/phosphopantothenate--cysteine ligase